MSIYVSNIRPYHQPLGNLPLEDFHGLGVGSFGQAVRRCRYKVQV